MMLTMRKWRHGALLATTLRLLVLAIVLWLVLLAQAAWAEMSQAEALAAGKQLGNTAVTTALPAVNARTLPGFTTANPAESRYQSAGIGLEDAARTHLLTADPASPVGSLFSSIYSRPTFTLDRDDPLVKHTDSLIADAENKPDTGKGTACKTLKVTDPPIQGKDTCMKYLQTEKTTCTRSLDLTCTAREEGDAGGIVKNSIAGDMKWDYAYPNLVLGTIADNYWGNGVYDRTTVFTIKNKADIKAFKLTHAWFDDWLWVKVNGKTVYVGPYGGDRLQLKSICVVYFEGSCSIAKNVVYYTATDYANPELSTSWNKALSINLLPYLKEGSNTLWMRTIVAGGGESAINIEARQWGKCTQWQGNWTNTCGPLADDPACERLSSRCTDSDNPRVIDGTPVSRACWEYTDTYRCYAKNNDKEEDDYCQELRDAGCTQINSQCVDDVYGRCIAWEQTYQCTVPGKTHKVEDCSAANYCQDGNCFDAGYAANTDFGLAASYLSSAEEMGKDMGGTPLHIFSGDHLKCKKVVLGFKNCCKNSGWGLNVNLSQCAADEKILAEKRGAGMCHYLGSYKDGSLFPNRYDSYCCFNSKLARIIHEQGRPYVPLAWGSAKSPVCRGFTPAELKKIDFSKIDFSEFFADALANAAQAIKPGSGALGKLIQDKITRLLPK